MRCNLIPDFVDNAIDVNLLKHLTHDDQKDLGIRLHRAVRMKLSVAICP